MSWQENPMELAAAGLVDREGAGLLTVGWTGFVGFFQFEFTAL